MKETITAVFFIIGLIVGLTYNYKVTDSKRKALVYYATSANQSCEEVIEFIKENL